MPELPEVEITVRGLRKNLIGRAIKDVWTDWPKYFKLHKSTKDFKKHVVGKKILNIWRRGKNILFDLSDSHLLLIHQKLSGHLLVGKWRQRNNNHDYDDDRQNMQWIPNPPRGPAMDPVNRFIRLIFFLDNGEMLSLSDIRRFAKVLCGPKEKILNLPDLKDLGPEPLDQKFTFNKFKSLFKNKKGRIKQLLLDQNFISGIGNIYADEALWFSKIHPLTKAYQLKVDQLKVLYRAIRHVLQKGIQTQGASIDNYRDVKGRKGSYQEEFVAYGLEGEPCKRCKTPIKRIKIGVRSSHFCPNCQVLRSHARRHYNKRH